MREAICPNCGNDILLTTPFFDGQNYKCRYCGRGWFLRISKEGEISFDFFK